MVHYEGSDIAADLAPLIRHMEAVGTTREALQRLQATWDQLSLLGEFSGVGIRLGPVRTAFEDLSASLIGQLASEARRKTIAALQGRAQVAIDILVRNLFERTADIGFLATDADLQRFAESSPAERDRDRPQLVERLREYQRSYTVYDDAVLLDPAGAVLARLQPGDVASTDDAFVGESVGRGAPFVEAFGRFALWPDRPRSLVYARRVTGTAGDRCVGALCLSFRFDDECRLIFAGLRRPDDWTVLALLDASGRVIATSDDQQLPTGAALAADASPGTRLIRFGGRRWLAVTCAANPYQGYAGPGWSGAALVPLDVAFDEDAALPVAEVSPAHAAALAAGRRLFAPALRAIPTAALAIEADLRRAVWNGHVSLGGATADRDGAFSKVLLREIGQTGRRTSEVFTRAIAELDRTVVSSLLDDTAARAALAIDILDRNLYERANDCRWWALTGAFRSALENGTPDAAGRAALTRVLQSIHALYTVYANLVLFDCEGRVVAASIEEGAAAPGQPLGAEWVGRTLALADTQAWVVSGFEPSPLYDGRPTQVYGAAVRGAVDAHRVVGGIAIVFDAAPQFEAMLADTLPRDQDGTVRDGSFNVFVDDGGRVLSRSTGGPAIGTRLDAGAGGASGVVVEREGRLWARGGRASSGYREYRGGRDPARSTISALCFVPLTDAVESAGRGRRAASSPPVVARPGRGAGAQRIDLASFEVDGQWYALRSADVHEATAASQRVLPLPQAGGCVLHGTRPVIVVDLAQILGAHGPEGGGTGGGVIIIVRGGEAGPTFGLRVDALGDNPEIDPEALQPLGGGSLIEALVRPGDGATGGELLRLLSPAAIASAAFGRRMASRAA